MMPGIELIHGKNDEYVENIDFEDPEYNRQLLRPAEIKEDVKLMEQRHRVSGILHSNEFHNALNTILDHHLREGEVCGGLAGSATELNTEDKLRAISNFLFPKSHFGGSIFNQNLSMPIIPINDLRSKNLNFTKQEKFLRCKLAAVYRLIDLHGLTTGMMLYASTRIIREENIFLVNSYGLMNHEITARNLIKINFDGETEDCQSFIDHNSWVLHAAIHNADPSMRCVIHIKTSTVVAVSCMKAGLVAISDEAMKLGFVPMYAWGSSVTKPGDGFLLSVEQEALGKAMEDSCCIFVRNRGLLVRGKTVEDAWRVALLAVQACEVQVRLATSVDSSKLLLVTSKPIIASMDEQEANLQFEGLMRSLDDAGYQTGYLYRHSPTIKEEEVGPVGRQVEGSVLETDIDEEDVEIPPSVTWFPSRDIVEGDRDEATERTRAAQIKWHIHCTNDYVRQETDETNGRRNGRKTVSWSQVSPDQRSGNVVVEVSTCANQFAPQGTDPNEFRHKQQKIKAKYYMDETSPGHQSRLLRSLEESNNMTVVHGHGQEDDICRTVLVGAVSQGIIDKQHRHDPSVYQTSYSTNPFNRVTNDDLQQYQHRIDRLHHGLPLVDADDCKTHCDVDEKCCIVVTTSPDQLQGSLDDVGQDANSIAPQRLCASRIDTLRSETSGADMSSREDSEHDTLRSDTEAHGKKNQKKKKKLRAIFSFRKDKSK